MWLSGLKIQHCYYSGLGCNCGVRFISGPHAACAEKKKNGTKGISYNTKKKTSNSSYA